MTVNDLPLVDAEIGAGNRRVDRLEHSGVAGQVPVTTLDGHGFEWTGGPSVPWQDAGGSIPSFGALTAELVGGAAASPMGLGTGVKRDSLFGQSGVWCDAWARIQIGTSPTPAGGFWTIAGLPVTPRGVTHGTSNEAGIRIGDLHILHTASKTRTDCGVYADNGSLGQGVFIFREYDHGTADGVDVLVPTDFAFSGHEMICHDSVPFDLVAGDVINLTLRYEATPA